MSASTNWPISTHARRYAARLSSALLALLLVVSLIAPTALADDAVEIVDDSASYTFSEAIYFDLEAKADQPIVWLTLFYGLDGGPVLRRIYPDYAAGESVQVEYVEELEAGQFAPGQTLRYFWRIELADGTEVETPESRFTYQDDRFDWQVISGSVIDLHYYGNAKRQAGNLLVTAQQAQSRLSTDVGVATDRRLQIYLYNSERDMSGALTQRSSVYDSMVTTLGVAVSDDTLLLLGSHSGVEETLAHELSHLVVGLATENPYAGLPRWLDEGLAMYAEGALPRANQRALDDAIHNDALLTIRSMSSYSGEAEQVDMYYGSVYSVVEFMLDTYGRDKMREFLQVFAQGSLQEDALQAVYGLDLDQLDAAWRVSLGLEPRDAPNVLLLDGSGPEPLALSSMAFAVAP